MAIVQSTINDQMRKDWGSFWNTSKAGDKVDTGAGWNVVRDADGGATYTGTDGSKLKMTAGMSMDDAAKANKDLANVWGNTYGYKAGEDYKAPEAVTYAATTRNVQDTDLAQNQLKKILADGSPLLDQAAGKAMQTANARGLVNSSIAAQAGTEAMIGQALPIATQDAQTYLQQGLANQSAQNQASQFNASAQNQSNLTAFNANVQTARDQAQNAFSASQTKAQNEYNAAENAKSREQNQKQFDASQALARDQLNNNQFNQYTNLYMGILDGQDSQEIKQTKIQHLNSLYFGKGFTPSTSTASQLQNALPAVGGGSSTGAASGGAAAGGSTAAPQQGQQVTVGGQTGVVVYDTAGKPYLQTPDGSYYELQNA